jgi:hypothetical protein
MTKKTHLWPCAALKNHQKNALIAEKTVKTPKIQVETPKHKKNRQNGLVVPNKRSFFRRFLEKGTLESPK